jgi:ferredoxin-NADP reductase
VARTRKAELIDAQMLSPSVRGLRFRALDGAPVGHLAGQYLDLIVPTARGLPFRRSYSIASAPDAAEPSAFELAVTRVEEGPTSLALHDLPLGGTVEIEAVRGTFVRTEADRARPSLFVAAGTGLAPIRAMLAEEVQATSGAPLVLLFGCRAPQDLLWGDELRGWARTSPRFQLHVTLSRPPAGWSGRTGYVQRHATALARSLPGVPGLPGVGAQAYVCGLSAMVDDVVALLARDAGFLREALRYETYD